MITDEKLLSVAIEYYINKKTQEEIAKLLSVSHVQVGKYLKEAQRRNIVSITVNLPISKDKEKNLKDLFREIFGLKNLVLVQGSDNSDKSHIRVVEKAASYILENLPQYQCPDWVWMGQNDA
jgi:Transcriptional regulator, contains sigma factor-related N-terminal domain